MIVEIIEAMLQNAHNFHFWYQEQRKRKGKLKDENGIGWRRLANGRISELKLIELKNRNYVVILNMASEKLTMTLSKDVRELS